VALFAFSTDPVATDREFSMAQFGAPSAQSVGAVNVRSHEDHEDRAWFDGFRTGPLRTIAARDLPDADRLDAARFCHSVTVDVPDPVDLSHLQAAWAIARWLVDGGCFAVLDGFATTWHDAKKLSAWSPDRPFNLVDEVTLTIETEPSDGFGHAVHTRGLAKFARPDLILGATPDEFEVAQLVLRALAGRMADGAIVEPGQTVGGNGRMFHVTRYAPGLNGPEVNLNNEGLLLVRDQ
jgi:hypothetical protein